MDVFLLPVTPAPPGSEPGFELYCEPPQEMSPEPGSTEPRRSLAGRLAHSFRQALAEGEAEERRQEDGHPPAESVSRFGSFVKRKLAAAVAEQRLLWHLRHASSARLHHPVTLTSARALALATAEFKRDFDKHRLWCGIDAAITVASAPVALIPGPNFLAYYFIFRSVGHFFSFRGAQKGMDASLWTAVPSTALADLQQALSLDGPDRDDKIADVASALGLERLPVFMRRVVARPRKH